MNENGHENGKEQIYVIDLAGRELDDGYTRTHTHCIECERERVQVMGLWCGKCYEKLCGEARFNWADLPRPLFEHYAREDAPAR